MDGLSLRRPVPPGRYPLPDLVEGLGNSPPLRALLGPECDAFLKSAIIEIVDDWGYMWVDNDDGTLYVSAPYWNNGDLQGLYLDLVHETVHVKQHHDGRELFDRSYKYVARPTEVEAYQVVVAEARRLGMSDEELCEFLYVEWIEPADHEELCRTVGVPYLGTKVNPLPERKRK